MREVIESHLHGSIERIEVQGGGFSPAFAGILTTDSGDEVFVKTGGPELNPGVPTYYRREWAIASALPAVLPTPRALWFEDDGRRVALAFEAIHGGNPRLPWRRDDLNRVLRALETMTRQLTPSPIWARSLGEKNAEILRGFRTLYAEEGVADGRYPTLDPWVTRHLNQLAKLESQWEESTGGTTLLHCDVRADNIVVRKGQVFFVDWAGGCIGPPWIELLLFLPSVSMQGGQSHGSFSTGANLLKECHLGPSVLFWLPSLDILLSDPCALLLRSFPLYGNSKTARVSRLCPGLKGFCPS
ncbi:MAG: phosphotransferase [Thermoplasmata archaeon]